MDITVNGEIISLSGTPTVASLLTKLDLEPRKIAVERNLEIVPRSLYEQTVLGPGDQIEIVQFVGGG